MTIIISIPAEDLRKILKLLAEKTDQEAVTLRQILLKKASVLSGEQASIELEQPLAKRLLQETEQAKLTGQI